MEQTQQVFETPAPKREERALLNAKTPRITGGWVDTPVPARFSNPPPPPPPLPPETRERLPPQASKNVYPSFGDGEEDTFDLLKRELQPLPSLREEEEVEPKEAEQVRAPSYAPPVRPPPIEMSQTYSLRPDPEPVDARLRRKKQGMKRVLEKPKLAKSALEVVLEEDAGYMTDGTVASLRKLLVGPDDAGKGRESPSETVGPSIPERRGFTSFPNEVRGADNAVAHATKETTRDVKPPRPPQVQREPVATDSRAANTARTSTAVVSLDRAHLRAAERRTISNRKDDSRASSSSLPTLRLWQRDSLSDSLHLTTFGWSVLVLSAYLLIECFLSAHLYPRYSPMCDYGICAYHDAPKFPLTLPTLFCRWSGLSMVFAPIKTVVIVLYRLFAQLFGLWDGFVGEGTSYNRHLHQANNLRQHQYQPPPPPPPPPPPQAFEQVIQDRPVDPNFAVNLDFGMHQDEVV